MMGELVLPDGRQCDPQRQLRRRGRCAGGDERHHRAWASAVSEDKDNWTPYNTTVFTKDGVVSNILRIWVP